MATKPVPALDNVVNPTLITPDLSPTTAILPLPIFRTSRILSFEVPPRDIDQSQEPLELNFARKPSIPPPELTEQQLPKDTLFSK